jgi:hypothetical protein
MQQDLVGPGDLAVELRVEIARAGIKQYIVARRLGISDTKLSGYLTGRLLLTEDIAKDIRRAIAEAAA